MARAKRDEAEIQATVAALPLEPSAEVIEKAKTRCNADYLIYKAGYWTEPLTGEKEKTALVHCTACGEEVHLGRWDYPHAGCRFAYSTEKIGFLDPADNMPKGSYDSCICPCCGKGVEALHVSKIKNEYVMCSFVFMTLHNVRGHFVLLSWKLFKRCDKSGKVRFDLFRRDGWAVIDGVPVWVTGYTTGGYGGVSWSENWLVRPRFSCDIEEWDEDEILEFNPHVLWTSDGEKSALDVFIKECGEEIPIVAYLVAWAKYPQIENLVRSGYSLYVRRLLNACIFTSGYYYSSKKTFYISGIKKYIDIKKVKPHEILRIEKMDMYLVNILSLEELALYGTVWKKKKVKLSIEQIREAERWNFSSMKELMEDYAPSYQKVLSYLDKQSKKKVRKKTVSINPLGLSYEQYIAGEYDASKFNKKQLEQLRQVQAVNIHVYTTGELMSGALNYEPNKDYSKVTKRDFIKRSTKVDFVSKAIVAIIFGCFTLPNILTWNWSGLLWTLLETVVIFGLSVMKYFNAYNFITEEMMEKIVNKTTILNTLIAEKEQEKV